MTQETIQLGATFAIAMALIELVKFVVGKYTNASGDKSKEILEQVTKTNENHLPHVEDAIREQTKLFQQDHIRNVEVLYQIKAAIDQLLKK